MSVGTMTKEMSAQQIIDFLNLEPLPGEGGFFKQTFKSKTSIKTVDASESPVIRSASTAIYYLITPESFSSLHRLPFDEVFHFYCGDPVEMVQFAEGGGAKKYLIGTDLVAGQRPQVVVPAKVWQGSRLVAGGRWALLGTTVAPGFEFEDLELFQKARLDSLPESDASLLRPFLRTL
jgi:uncharacterized protein